MEKTEGNTLMELKARATLDTVGMLCPIPVYLTNKKMKELSIGDVLEVFSDDEGILSDLPAWCKATGNEVLLSDQFEGRYRFYIRRLV